MLGSLMMLASGVVASSPSSASASAMPLLLRRGVGELRDDPARQGDVAGLDRHPAVLAYAWMIGRNEYVASAGASSVCV